MGFKKIAMALIIVLLASYSIPSAYSVFLDSNSNISGTIILEEKPNAPFTQEVEELNKDSGLTFVPVVDDATGEEEGFIVKQPGTSEGDNNVTGQGSKIDVSMKIPAGKRCCVSITMDLALVSSASVTLKIGDKTYGPVAYNGYYGERYFGISNGTLKQSSAQNVWFITDSEIEVIITGQREWSSVVVKILVDNNVTNS